jgi:hypothetical protein
MDKKKFKDARKIREEAKYSPRNAAKARPLPSGWTDMGGGGYRNPTGYEHRPMQGPKQAQGIGLGQPAMNTAETTPETRVQSIFWKRLMSRIKKNDRRGRDMMKAPISQR